MEQTSVISGQCFGRVSVPPCLRGFLNRGIREIRESGQGAVPFLFRVFGVFRGLVPVTVIRNQRSVSVPPCLCGSKVFGC